MKEQETEVKRQRELVKSKLYPYLLKNTASIEEAKVLLEMTFTVLEQSFQKKMLELQGKMSNDLVSTLGIEGLLQENDDTKRVKELLAIFEKETIATADSLLVGMKREIEGRVKLEGTKRHLSTVESDFLPSNETDDNNNV